MEQVKDNQVNELEVYEDYELDTDPEWIQYCNDLEEWNDEVEEYSEYDYSQCLEALGAPLQLDEHDHDAPEYIVLGTVTLPQAKAKKSFKYTSKDFKIFCPTLLNKSKNNSYKKCSDPKCKYVHDFKDVTFCNGKCGRIELSNNYYNGNCFKRHSSETLDNFILRKSIRLYGVSSVSLELYKKPDEEFLRELLLSAKRLLLKEVNISLVKPKRTIEEWYA